MRPNLSSIILVLMLAPQSWADDCQGCRASLSRILQKAQINSVIDSGSCQNNRDSSRASTLGIFEETCDVALRKQKMANDSLFFMHSPMPSIFGDQNPKDLQKYDNLDSAYAEGYPISDFKRDLDAFINLGTDSNQDACKWLFWSNGVMRRPAPGTLCAIASMNKNIKNKAKANGIPPEYYACILGGDSMILHGNADYIANSTGKNMPADQYVYDAIQKTAVEDAKALLGDRQDYTNASLLDRVNLTGRAAKKVFDACYRGGYSVEFKAVILATLHNLGGLNNKFKKCSESNYVKKDPIPNYFGLNCGRLMKAYQIHLNADPKKRYDNEETKEFNSDHNPSIDACKSQ